MGTAEPDEWLDLALRAGDVVAWRWEPESRTSTWRGDLEYQHGVGPGTVDHLDAWLELLHPDDRGRFEQALRDALATGDTRFDVSYRLLEETGGSVRWMRSVGRVLPAEAGRPLWVVGVTTDLTDQREAEQRLERTALRNSFLADISKTLVDHAGRPSELLDAVARSTATFLDATCLIRLLGEERDLLGGFVIHGDEPELFEEVQQLLDVSDETGGLAGAVLSQPSTMRFPTPEGKPLADAVADRYRDVVDRFDPGSAVVVPLRKGTEAFGLLLVARHAGEPVLDDHDVALIEEVARRAELAVRNAVLVGSLREELIRRRRIESDLETRVSQQEALVELGRIVLEGKDLRAILSSAARLIANTLEVPFVSILEPTPSGEELVVRAAAGWPGHVIDDLRIPTGPRTQAGLVLETEEPVVIEDLADDERFPEPDEALARGIRSGVAVLIGAPDGRSGVLTAHDREARCYDVRDVTFLRAAGNVLASVIDRHRTQQRFLQAQRLEAVGRIAGGIAHDFNNLLTIIIGYAEMLRPQLQGGAEEDLDELQQAAERAAELVDNLLTFSRQEVVSPNEVSDVGTAILAIEPMLRRVLSERIELRVRVATGVTGARIDQGQLQQVLLNLVINAADAIPERGTVTIHARTTDLRSQRAAEFGLEAGEHVLVEVADTGTGMRPEVLGRVFEPFFTTKPVGQGSGLGLPTVFGIVRGLNGTMHIDSEPEVGTTVRILLPRHEFTTPPQRDGPVNNAVLPDVPAHGTILLVEDDEPVRSLTARVLRGRGYEVLSAAHGVQAIQLAGAVPELDLLVTDVVMPDMSGPELAERLRRDRPDLRTLYLSGYSEHDLPFDGVFVAKPYRIDQLTRIVALLLERRGPVGGR